MAKKSTKKRTSNSNQSGSMILSAAAILFAGALIILLGNLQSLSNLKLLMVGFGAALLVFSGALLGIASANK